MRESSEPIQREIRRSGYLGLRITGEVLTVQFGPAATRPVNLPRTNRGELSRSAENFLPTQRRAVPSQAKLIQRRRGGEIIRHREIEETERGIEGFVWIW
jgi:hypothetical protein